MAKRRDIATEKWEVKGYFAGLGENDKKNLAALMESGQVVFERKPSFRIPLSVTISQGRVDFDLSDLVYKCMRNCFEQTGGSIGVMYNYDSMYDELVMECSLMAEAFYGGDGAKMFDSVSHDAFAARFGYAYALKHFSKGGGK